MLGYTLKSTTYPFLIGSTLGISAYFTIQSLHHPLSPAARLLLVLALLLFFSSVLSWSIDLNAELKEVHPSLLSVPHEAYLSLSDPKLVELLRVQALCEYLCRDADHLLSP